MLQRIARLSCSLNHSTVVNETMEDGSKFHYIEILDTWMMFHQITCVHHF
jgi:hypothetical protein